MCGGKESNCWDWDWGDNPRIPFLLLSETWNSSFNYHINKSNPYTQSFPKIIQIINDAISDPLSIKNKITFTIFIYIINVIWIGCLIINYLGWRWLGERGPIRSICVRHVNGVIVGRCFPYGPHNSNRIGALCHANRFEERRSE